MDSIIYVGLDVRHVGVFANRPEILLKLAARLRKGGHRLSFAMRQALATTGCTDCWLAVGMSASCGAVTDPGQGGRSGEDDRRDGLMLAKLHRAGELTPIWIPDAAHEALRDLVRARTTAGRVLSKARQHMQSFLLRHDQIYRGVRAWTLAYRRWLTTVRFAHPAQQIILQDYIHAVQDAEARLERLTRQIEELLPNWSMAPVVATLQAMRGVALVVAVTVVAEVGDFRRFANARQLMAYLGLVPSEHSSGASVRRGGITKAGNVLARRVLIEGAWTYRMPARVSRKLHDRNENLPPAVRDIAWKAQLRLCSRYRRLAAAGKPKVVVTTAIAREMVGFIWAIARIAQPTLQG